MTDPRFPRRPDHDDFWLLAEVVQDLDSASDDGTPLERLTGPFVDLDSLGYVSQQRALRAQRMVNPLMARTAESEMVKLQATWLEGFMAGVLYRKYKTERATE